MSDIQFTTSEGWTLSPAPPGTFLLISDNWDDFHFKTTFKLHYTSRSGQDVEIGYIKIAYQGMKEGDAHTKLPQTFSQLPEKFFSLGQSREYYEQLMGLSNGEGMSVLKALRDIIVDENLYNVAENEKAFSNSLLREIPTHTVRRQFKRIVAGQAPLSPYKFYYTRQFKDALAPQLRLEFDVSPESTPPTNVHVLIGANGVGKSMLLRDMIAIVKNLSTAKGNMQNDEVALHLDSEITEFVNVVHVSYSAFDKSDEVAESVSDTKVHTVGLSKTLSSQFTESFWICSKEPKRKRLVAAISTLERADPLLADVALSELLSLNSRVDDFELIKRFESMSSGHKIAILTVTSLVELVEEQSLVLFDEPEVHLHPPLLSALTRTISDLIIDRNGVAIIATHSPVVLQEVPKSCVWRLQRSGQDLRASRLNTETFGESVSRLTSEVFDLNVRKTGYHAMLNELIDSAGSIDKVLSALDNQLGDEGRFILSSLAYSQGKKDV